MIAKKIIRLRKGLNKYMKSIKKIRSKRQWDCPIAWRLCIDKWESDGVSSGEIKIRLRALSTIDRLERASDYRFNTRVVNIAGSEEGYMKAIVAAKRCRSGGKVVTSEHTQ